MALIEYNNVTFTYPEMTAPAVKDLSLQVEKGQFIVLFGASGSGKSTLLRLLKKEIQPNGTLIGDIILDGKNLTETGSDSSRDIGFVFQDPENQLVAEEVLHELAFGLENIGLAKSEMRNRIAEMVHFMGAESMLHRKVHELSGGQKQQLNLASVLLMQPKILLLDEPTAQLDPVSTREFLTMIERLNEEFGLTVIMAEHRLDEVISYADKLVMMDKGEVVLDGRPKEVLTKIWKNKERERPFIPAIPSFYFEMADCLDGGSVRREDSRESSFQYSLPPLTVKEGRNWVETLAVKKEENVTPTNPRSKDGDRVEGDQQLHVKNLFFHYGKKKAPQLVLRELDFSLQKGEMYALLGGNGSGKSTLLKVLCGIHKAQKGKVWIDNKPLKSWKRQDLVEKVGYLPQNPKLFFLHDSVKKELDEVVTQSTTSSHDEVEALLDMLGIAHLIDKHPYDLSGGELQKAALACVLLRKPDVLLLDEPTKGLDPVSKKQLADIVKELRRNGMTILFTTHDVEFAAANASKCGMMFDGKITSEGEPAVFFKGNFFYTTMMQRLFREETSTCLTVEEACRQWT